MYSFRRAVEMGADVLEMDIHSTSDSHLITMHDAVVDRTTSGSVPVVDYTPEELQNLDAAYWWSAGEGATYPNWDQGNIVPTLDYVFADFPELWFNIEIKQEGPSIVR